MCRTFLPPRPVVASETLSARGTHRSPAPNAIPCGLCPTCTVVTWSVVVSIFDRLAALLLTTNRFRPSSVSAYGRSPVVMLLRMLPLPSTFQTARSFSIGSQALPPTTLRSSTQPPWSFAVAATP